MARSKKTPEYLNLPFEVHYSEIESIEYEPIKPLGKKISKISNYKNIAVRKNTSTNVIFRCSDPSGGALIYVLNGGLDEYIPDWLIFEDEEDRYCSSETRHSFTLKKGKFAIEFQLGDELEDDSEFDYLGEGIEFYEAYKTEPSHLILDCESSRIRIDLEGYKIDEEGDRLSESPLIKFTEDDVDAIMVTGKDHGDTYGEISKFLTK